MCFCDTFIIRDGIYIRILIVTKEGVVEVASNKGRRRVSGAMDQTHITDRRQEQDIKLKKYMCTWGQFAERSIQFSNQSSVTESFRGDTDGQKLIPSSA